MYRLLGHKPPLDANQRRANARPTLKAQLNAFRLRVRQCTELLFEAGATKLFAGRAQGQYRLRDLGISTNLAVLPFHPDLDQKLIDEINLQVVRSQRRWPIQQVRQALREGMPIEVRKVALKGRAKWLGQLRKWKNTKGGPEAVVDLVNMAVPTMNYKKEQGCAVCSRKIWVHR